MISILCSGSRGDVQPYIALAQALKRKGQSVRIVGMKSFSQMVKDHDIEFVSIDADFESLGVDPKMLEEARTSDNPLKMLLTFNKMKKYGHSLASDFYKACEESDLVVFHPGVSIAHFAAKQLNIPAVLASPFPLHRTQERLSVINYGKRKPSKFQIKMSYQLLQGMLWMAGKLQVKHFWKKTFNQLPKDYSAPYERHNSVKFPSLVSCSNHVFSRPNDWHENIHQYGYWFVDEPDFKPSDQLKNFLNQGDKPIYIGFGSVFDEKRKDEFIKMIVSSHKITGRRFLVSGMGEINDYEGIMSIGALPHTWLFKHVSAVCHHGGAGTSAAGFAAGVPSIIVPFSNDQFAWAHRAYDLGVGSQPIYSKNLSSEALIEAIDYISNEEVIENARALGQKIRKENGADKAADLIIKTLYSNK